jgi:hypothetical protein
MLPRGASFTRENFIRALPAKIMIIDINPPNAPDDIQAQLGVQWGGTPNALFKVSGPKIMGVYLR